MNTTKVFVLVHGGAWVGGDKADIFWVDAQFIENLKPKQ